MKSSTSCKYLCRIYVPQRDKLNVSKGTLNEALTLLNQTLDNVKVKINWLNIEDIYFNNTQNYIRIIKT
jgi:hypothetical protein